MIKIKYLIQTIRPKIQFIYLTAFFTGLIIASNGNLSINLNLGIGLLSFFLIQGIGTYFINAFADIETDTINKPERASAKKLIKKEELLTISILSYFIGISLASLINETFFFISILTAIIGTTYSLKPIHLKSKGILCTLTIVYAHSISILFGATIITNNPFNLIFLQKIILIQALISFFVAFSKDIPDIKGDKKYKIKTLAVILGEKKSTKLMIILPFIPLLYLLIPKLQILTPILTLGFIYSLLPLKQKKYMKTFQRSVYFTIIQNLTIITIFLFL